MNSWKSPAGIPAAISGRIPTGVPEGSPRKTYESITGGILKFGTILREITEGILIEVAGRSFGRTKNEESLV